MIDWNQIRLNYPLVEKGGYFNTASFGALSNNTVANQNQHLDDLLEHGNQHYDSWLETYFLLKAEMSSYLRCEEKNIAFFPDVSNGVNKISELLSNELEIILVREDFPSVTLPWITREYKINWIEYHDFIDDYLVVLESKLKEGAKILCLSWVFYNHGFMIDPIKVGQLCSKYDCYFILDATQGLGAFQLDVSKCGVDFMVSSCFKWFMAGYGITIGYVSNSILDRFDLKQSGWNVLNDFTGNVEGQDNYKIDASKFEIGHIKFQNISMLYNSFLEMKNIGLQSISDRTNALSVKLKNELISEGHEVLVQQEGNQSSIISIRSNTTKLKNIKEAGIICSPRKDYIRFAVYFYNNEQDINHLIDCLKQ